MSIRYVSTRGQAPELGFEDVLLAGLASDGGLYVPTSLPKFDEAQLRAMQDMSYPELAFEIVSPFIGDCISETDLRAILEDTYASFRHPAVAPLVQLDHNQWVLELFQGPTLAFKDFALQLLGRLLDHVLARRGEKVVIMGATSGDTGSAAIEGCKRCDNIDIFILHPHERVSEVQRRQMTTVMAPNIHNIAVQGNFDDCQAMVKTSFVAEPFLPDGRRLVAVNSINWARIMAQIVYYFYSALALGRIDRPTSFSVPTGNFGDIFAGYLAKQMGLPVEKLVIATNRNDVLHRVLTEGVYASCRWRLLYHPVWISRFPRTLSACFSTLLIVMVMSCVVGWRPSLRATWHCQMRLWSARNSYSIAIEAQIRKPVMRSLPSGITKAIWSIRIRRLAQRLRVRVRVIAMRLW